MVTEKKPAPEDEPKSRRMKGEDRKKQILRTARRVFAEHSYHGATTAKIAEAAGVTEPTIYLHFESKKALFIAVIEDFRELIVAITLKILNNDDSMIERYDRIFDTYPVFTNDAILTIGRIGLSAISMNDPDVEASMKRLIEEIMELAAKGIGQAAEKENIQLDQSPEMLANLIGAVSMWQAMLAVLGADKDRSGISLDLKEFIKGLLSKREK